MGRQESKKFFLLVKPAEGEPDFSVYIRCPCCSGPVSTTNMSVPMTREARAILICEACGVKFLWHSFLSEVSFMGPGGRGTPFPHGTEAGYTRHRRQHEAACPECALAHRESTRESARQARARRQENAGKAQPSRLDALIEKRSRPPDPRVQARQRAKEAAERYRARREAEAEVEKAAKEFERSRSDTR